MSPEEKLQLAARLKAMLHKVDAKIKEFEGGVQIRYGSPDDYAEDFAALLDSEAAVASEALLDHWRERRRGLLMEVDQL